MNAPETARPARILTRASTRKLCGLFMEKGTRWCRQQHPHPSQPRRTCRWRPRVGGLQSLAYMGLWEKSKHTLFARNKGRPGVISAWHRTHNRGVGARLGDLIHRKSIPKQEARRGCQWNALPGRHKARPSLPDQSLPRQGWE